MGNKIREILNEICLYQYNRAIQDAEFNEEEVDKAEQEITELLKGINPDVIKVKKLFNDKCWKCKSAKKYSDCLTCSILAYLITDEIKIQIAEILKDE